MVNRPDGMGTFEFAVVSGLRVAQLIRGCTPRLSSTHKRIVTAQLEVAAGAVARVPAITSAGEQT